MYDYDQNVIPCALVKKIWHQHILDTGNYCRDMILLCGRVLESNPDTVMTTALALMQRQQRCCNTEQLLKRRFGSEYSAKIWADMTISILETSTGIKHFFASRGGHA